MFIIPITQSLFKNHNNSDKTENKNIYPSFQARVDKGMARFYEVNADKMPYTLKTYIESLKDRFSITPLEATRNAFAALLKASTIDDVRTFYQSENEKLFDNLVPSSETKATNGILGIFREFKEIYQSILKSGEDLSVYLLKKIFIEAKTIDEINLDLETDLNSDIAQEFKNRHGESKYILSSTLKALGISTPDLAYQNSLRFTRDGYSDKFGLKISEGQLKYWNSLSDEQKFEILSKRLEGRDNWWNNLSYDEKLEYAAGIESEEELYNNYKKYVSLQKRRKTYGEIGEEGSKLNQVQLTQKKISVGSKLQHKDIFGLWMKKNLENFYKGLSEADKDVVHMKRVRRLAVRWQTMTPEEKTELINKMKEGREPLRYTMIDAWNHSHNIIKELSKFLKEKQILKPLDMLYSSEGFSEFQSQIMTEFWGSHPEFAVQLGENIKKAHERVRDSISRGQFQDLKQEILRDRAYRIKLVERELKIEEQKASEITEITPKPVIPLDYKNEFAEAYKNKFNADQILPESYVNDVISNMLEHKSEEWIKKYTDFLKTENGIPSLEIMEDLMKDETLLYNSEKQRYSRAFEFAVASELFAKQHDPNIFGVDYSVLETYLRRAVFSGSQNNVKKSDKIDLARIEKLYKEYKKDLPIDELQGYVLNYFIPKSKSNTDIDKLSEYVELYGKGISMLFSEQSIYPTEVKIALKDKFYRFMPEDLKEKYIFLLKTDKQARNEKIIKQINSELLQRYSYINKDFVKLYLEELDRICRYFGDSDSEAASLYAPNAYLKMMGINRLKKNGASANISVPRHSLSNDAKYELLAMEQAMADELFNASGDEKVYKLTFEAMCDMFEQADKLRKNPKAERKLIINDTLNGIQEDELVLTKIPNKMNVNSGYYGYCEDFKSVIETIEKENRDINDEDILFWLNPEDGNDLRDDIVMNRIQGYYINN